MNTIFVSGTVSATAQLKMGDQGYLVTFKMTNEDKCLDADGALKKVNTDWSVVLQYDEEPIAILKKLEKGSKVLVKGDATITHAEVNNIFELNCVLQGKNLNFLDVAMRGVQKSSAQFTEQQSSAMAS